MTPARFLETRTPAWDRLEALVAKTGRRGVSRLGDAELHELTRLYPAVAVDVARARMYKIDRRTLERVNRLAIAAHGLLYRRPHARPWRAIGRFLCRDYPALFRRHWPYMILATTLFLVAASAAYVTVRVRPPTAHLFVPGSVDLVDDRPGLSAEDISERFRSMPKPPMAAGIMTNNISVALHAFAFGITAGVGTCYVILVNAVMLGAFAAHFDNHQLGFAFWSFITAHGVLEIMAILVSAAAGLRLGLSLALPGRLTRGASLRAGARDAVLLVLGTIPMFIVAGAIEGFVTPTFLPGGLKIAIGWLVWALAMAYLLLVGHADGATPSATDGPAGRAADVASP